MDRLFEIYTAQEAERIIARISEMIENGAETSAIVENLSDVKMLEELISIAKARKRFSEKEIDSRLYLNLTDLRFSTPKIVADYRAERLKCEIIADLGSGTGMQSFAFAKKCKKVYAIEIDERKIEYAKQNAKILGIKNIEFIQGDILDERIIKKIKDADVFFCDPERLPSETERKLETILPDPKVLLKKYPKNLAVEFPPQIREIPLDCEKEYLSVNGVLNRLDLYFGNLKKCSYSAVSLPSKERLEGDKKEEVVILGRKGLPLNYIYEVDSAVAKAGLVPELIKRTKTVAYDAAILTSDKPIKNKFFRNSFKVLESCDPDFDSIVNSLQKHKIGQIVLRQKIDPRLYWKTRTDYEKKLSGKKTAHLFILEKAVVAEKIP